MRATSSQADQLQDVLEQHWPEIIAALLWPACLAWIVAFPSMLVIPFYLIWITAALLYFARSWAPWPTLWLSAALAIGTASATGVDVSRGLAHGQTLIIVPLLAALAWVVPLAARYQLTREVQSGSPAASQRPGDSQSHDSLPAAQRQFIQDATHELKTPITIALGHAELLARELASQRHKRDIEIVVGELNRLRTLSERLLLIASSENPDFLRLEPVTLESLIMELYRRWQPTAPRRWRLGTLTHVVALADAERLRIALDALLENAVRHTGVDGVIELSVICGEHDSSARMVVQDEGEGIPHGDLEHIFDRFRTGGSSRGTGLGLALARAIARGHGGELRARSVAGKGSSFELVLPVGTSTWDRQSPATDARTATPNAGGGTSPSALTSPPERFR